MQIDVKNLTSICSLPPGSVIMPASRRAVRWRLPEEADVVEVGTALIRIQT